MRWLAIICLALAATAMDPSAPRAESDHDRARAAVRAGHIKPLNQILGPLQRRFPGRVLGVELKGGNGGNRPWIYDIKMLSPSGDVRNVTVDARTANILGVRGRGRVVRQRGAGEPRRGFQERDARPPRRGREDRRRRGGIRRR